MERTTQNIKMEGTTPAAEAAKQKASDNKKVLFGRGQNGD